MHHAFWRTTVKVLSGITLIILLISCGSNLNSNTTTRGLPSTPSTLISSPTSTPTPSPTPTPLPNEVTALSSNGISFTVANLNIYSATGLQCKYHYQHPLPANLDDTPTLPHGNLVLTSNNLTYDSGTIQQMKDYTTAFYGNKSPLPPLPNGLNWLSASSECQLPLDITNTGNTAVQVDTTNIQLTAAPQVNKQHYNLVDICSLEEGYTCPPQVGGGAGIFYQFQLEKGNAYTVFSPTSYFNSTTGDSSQKAIPFTINGGGAVHIDMAFTSSSNTRYPIVPNIVLDTESGPRTIALSQLSGTLFIADHSLFSCYQLQGNTFVSESPTPLNTCV